MSTMPPCKSLLETLLTSLFSFRISALKQFAYAASYFERLFGMMFYDVTSSK